MLNEYYSRHGFCVDRLLKARVVIADNFIFKLNYLIYQYINTSIQIVMEKNDGFYI